MVLNLGSYLEMAAPPLGSTQVADIILAQGVVMAVPDGPQSRQMGGSGC
jgi:hypothetical protein